MIGVSEEKFYDSDPKELEPYQIAYKWKQEENDAESWNLGAYVVESVIVALDHVLNGKKAKAEYPKKPFLQTEEAKNKTKKKKLTKEEQLQGEKNLLMYLQTMQRNFERNHKGKKKK